MLSPNHSQLTNDDVASVGANSNREYSSVLRRHPVPPAPCNFVRKSNPPTRNHVRSLSPGRYQNDVAGNRGASVLRDRPQRRMCRCLRGARGMWRCLCLRGARCSGSGGRDRFRGLRPTHRDDAAMDGAHGLCGLRTECGRALRDAHLSDDEAVAKMGHPRGRGDSKPTSQKRDVGHPPFVSGKKMWWERLKYLVWFIWGGVGFPWGNGVSELG